MVKGIVPFDENGALKDWQELYRFPLFSESGEVLGIIEYVCNVARVKKLKRLLRN